MCFMNTNSLMNMLSFLPVDNSKDDTSYGLEDDYDVNGLSHNLDPSTREVIDAINFRTSIGEY